MIFGGMPVVLASGLVCSAAIAAPANPMNQIRLENQANQSSSANGADPAKKAGLIRKISQTNLAELYEARQFSQAEAIARNLLQSRPTDFTAHFYRAHCLVMLNRSPEALSEYEKSLPLAPTEALKLMCADAVKRLRASTTVPGLAPNSASTSSNAQDEALKKRIEEKATLLVENKRAALDRDIAKVKGETDEAMEVLNLRYPRRSEYNMDERYNREAEAIKIDAQERIQALKERFDYEAKKIKEAYQEQASKVSQVNQNFASRKTLVSAKPSNLPPISRPSSSPATAAAPSNIAPKSKSKLTDDDITYLRNSEVTFVVEQSAAMSDILPGTKTTRNAFCLEHLSDFAGIASSEQASFSVVPSSETFGVIDNCSSRDLLKAFSEGYTLRGADLVAPVDYLGSRYFGSKPSKKLLLVLVVSGKYSLDDSLERAIAKLSRRMEEPGQVRILFISVGADQAAEEYLQRLASGTIPGCKFPIVEFCSYSTLQKSGLTSAVLKQ